MAIPTQDSFKAYHNNIKPTLKCVLVYRSNFNLKTGF